MDQVRKRAPGLEQLAGIAEDLLPRLDVLLDLNLAHETLDRVRGRHLEHDGLARRGLDKDLHGAPADEACGVLGFIALILLMIRLGCFNFYCLQKGKGFELLMMRDHPLQSHYG